MMKQLFEDKKLWIRRVFLMCYDICAVFAASMLALLARFDFNFDDIPSHFLENAWKSLGASAITTILIFWIFRLYSSLWSYAGAMEMMYLVSACVTETVVNMVLIPSGDGISRTAELFRVLRHISVRHDFCLPLQLPCAPFCPEHDTGR